MAYLTVRIKETPGHTTEVLPSEERVTVGRASSASLTIKHDSISREHCAFIRSENGWSVEDLGSANGTRVNSTTISECTPLKERDIIKIGKARLTFHRGRPSKKKAGDEIAINDADDQSMRQVGPDDPSQAMPCHHCGTWLSISHRLPGDRIHCPRCDHSNVVPVLIIEEHAAEASSE
ncbi:MAG: FHA domain-containing protein [Planctomycetota bacterium]|nr:MAG: FHA domain-containing protein [Planctomycetota bacterium]